jgi:hypothetical protein
MRRAGLLLASLPGSLWKTLWLSNAVVWLLSGVVSTADADIIRCSFTEPFVVTTYSTNTKELNISYDVETAKNKTLKDVSLQIMGPGVFELWDDQKQVAQRLELSYTGSDGMSDFVYPYSVHWIPEDLHGGCTSNHQNRK